MTRKTIFRTFLPLTISLLAAAAPAQEPGAGDPGLTARTFFLENADVKDVLTVLRSMTALPHLAADQGLQIIDARGPADLVEYAERLVEAHDQRPREVTVEARLVELDPEKLHRIGREPGDGGGMLPSRLSPEQLERLLEGAGARLIAHPTLSATAGRKAEVMIGDRVPITVDGEGTVSYQEVGFRLGIRPRAHPKAGEVTLDFELEISRRDSTSARPVISTRRLTSSVRVGDGTTYFLAGLSHGADGAETAETALALTPRIR